MSCCPTCNQPVSPLELLVSLDTHKAARNGVTVQLTPNEAVLLRLMVDKWPGTASSPYLLDGLYGLFGEAPEDGNAVLKVSISHLRRKLTELYVQIETIQTRGYRVNELELGHLNA